MTTITVPAGTAIILLDKEGTVLEMNQAAKQILGETTAQATAALSLPPQDGAIITVQAQEFRLDVLETPQVYCVVLRDITEWRRVNQQIELQQLEIEALRRQVQKERERRETQGRVVAHFAHEFGTPLSVIRASANIVSHYHDRLSPEKLARQFELIDGQVVHATDLLQDLAAISQIVALGKTAHPDAINLETLCQSVLHKLTLRFERAAQTVMTFTGDVTDVHLDKHLLNFVLTNMLSNALKYSPEGGEIRLDVLGSETEVIVHVTDQGIGIPADEMDKVFDPFYRASNAANFDGTGLGLAIVKSSVEALGGRIAVESQVGRGTAFTVCLPRQMLSWAGQ